MPPKICTCIVFSFSWESCNTQKRLKKQRLRNIFVWGVGRGEDGGKEGAIMGDVQMANSFHLNTGTLSRNYRQGDAFQIKSIVWEFKMKVRFLKVIFIRKHHLCWGVSERFYRVILPTFVLFPDDVEFHVFPSTSWYLFM